jgi:hypothetical protein
MREHQPGSIKTHFSNIADPRDLNKRHKLIDIITIAICAVVCGAIRGNISKSLANQNLTGSKTFWNYPTVSPLTIHMAVFLPKLIRMNFDSHL